MLLQWLTQLQARRIVLASASPRRRDILSTNLGLAVEVCPSSFVENLDKQSMSAEEYVVATARGKAMQVWQMLQAGCETNKPWLVIGADTVVVHSDGSILEKPKDADDAFSMLVSLRATPHRVVTGVVLIWADGHRTEFHEATKVIFDSDVPDDELRAYVATGEPLDKAGGYGIQARAAGFIAGVDGCYFNVCGFPLARFCRQVAQSLPHALQ